MTCIVGIVEKDGIYMGADSALSSSDDYDLKRLSNQSKIFTKKNMIFGCAGVYRCNQIIRHCFNIPNHPPRKSNLRYLCSDFVDGLMKCLLKKMYATKENNAITIEDTILIGYQDKLYEMDNVFCISSVKDRYTSIGSGSGYALGSLHTTEKIDVSPEERIKKALSAAAFFSSSVSKPFKILKLKKDLKK